MRTASAYPLKTSARHGDLHFPPPLIEYYQSFKEVCEGWTLDDLDDFWAVYLERISKLARRLMSDDTLYLAVSGRGCLLVGDDFNFIQGRPSSLRVAMEGRKAAIHLVTSARVPWNWASPCWTFFSVAPEEREPSED